MKRFDYFNILMENIFNGSNWQIENKSLKYFKKSQFYFEIPWSFFIGGFTKLIETGLDEIFNYNSTIR